MDKSKELRDFIQYKFNGLCAYSGTPLEADWQVDHIHPKCKRIDMYHQIKTHNDIENLIPSQRIINHYKRSLDLREFRKYMMSFHKRLAKLPKRTSVRKTQKRIEYMNKIAFYFGITVDKPFNGVFYFETINPILK